MKASNVLILFISITVGVFFGLFIGGLQNSIVSNSLLDAKVGLGDLATWTAALCTFGTLIFLVQQNIQLHKDQNRERLNRESHEKKQQEMWHSQSEMFAFQNYQMHRQEFENLLRSIERKYDDSIHFYDKARLYLDIFPSNSFRHTHYDLSEESKSILFTVSKIVESQSKHLANMIASDNYSQSNLLETSTQLLAEHLKVKFIGPSKPGDISNHTCKILNFIHPTEYLGRLVNINNDLREFACLPTVYLEHSSSIERPLSLALARYYLEEPAPDYIRAFNGPYEIAKLLTNAWDILINELSGVPSAKLSHMRADIIDAFTTFKFPNRQLDPNNSNAVRTYLRNLESNLGHLCTEYPVQSSEWVSIRNLAMNIDHEIRLVDFEKMDLSLK